MNTTSIENNVLDNYYEKINELIINSKKRINRNINYEMVELYFNIGRIINELIEKYHFESSQNEIIKKFSDKLTKNYGSGFNISNLKAMKKFYLTYKTSGHTVCDQLYSDYTLCNQSNSSGATLWHQERKSGSTLWHQLSWSHNRIIMNIDDKKKRTFYLEESIKSNWSVRQLERQINSFYYERLLSTNEKNKEEVRNEINKLEKKESIKDFIKDPYILEFLDIKDNKFLEKDLESNILEHLQDFLLELGRGFSFISRQKRIDVDGDNFYIDLVFYNYILKCFVLIDLKLGKLTHQDIGQMDFYVRYYDNEIKDDFDNPTIGIILCSSKKDIIVKYSVLNDNKNLFASKYKLILPTEKEFVSEIEKIEK